MVTQQHLASFKRADRDLYAREEVLNSAIIAADLRSGWEKYLEIFDAFYSDHGYIGDFDRLVQIATTARELYDDMLQIYPDRANPGSLWGAAPAAKP